MQLEFSRQIYEKSSSVKLHEYKSSGSRAVPCGRTRQTDRRTIHDEANSRFSQFCEKKKKKDIQSDALRAVSIPVSIKKQE
jgi:hypothetical protein